MKIKFLPTNQEIEGDPNKTLLQLCTENKIEIKSICKGVPSCAECRVRIVEGEHNIVPPTKAEMSLIGTNYFIDQRRLSCQIHCYGDITVDLTEQIERSEIQSKKIRGFRSPHQKGTVVETHAKQGTMVLDEPAPPPPQSSEAGGQRQQARNQNKNQNQRKQGGGQGQNQNRNNPKQGAPKQQGQQRPAKGAGGPGPNNPNQKRNEPKNQNRPEGKPGSGPKSKAAVDSKTSTESKDS
jgi:ferredoxin